VKNTHLIDEFFYLDIIQYVEETKRVQCCHKFLPDILFTGTFSLSFICMHFNKDYSENKCIYGFYKVEYKIQKNVIQM
jgi:hypothetical protein